MSKKETEVQKVGVTINAENRCVFASWFSLLMNSSGEGYPLIPRP